MSEIIPNVVVSMPSQLFTMARSFKACSNGRIYIGKIDTDPTIPENQIQVYMERENGDLVPASQPIIINAAGYPVYAGQIAKFVTVEGHSMAVYDSYGVQQHYWQNVLKYNPDQFERRLSESDGYTHIGGLSEHYGRPYNVIIVDNSPYNGDLGAAIDAADENSVLILGKKTYNIVGKYDLKNHRGNEKRGLTIRGIGMPSLSEDGTCFVDGTGTVIQGELLNFANDFCVCELGIDVGSYVVDILNNGVYMEGLVPGTWKPGQTESDLGTYITGVNFGNIRILMKKSSSDSITHKHGCLVEHIDGGTHGYIEVVGGFHGFVMKSMNIVPTAPVRLIGQTGDSYIFKSDAYSRCLNYFGGEFIIGDYRGDKTAGGFFQASPGVILARICFGVSAFNISTPVTNRRNDNSPQPIEDIQIDVRVIDFVSGGSAALVIPSNAHRWVIKDGYSIINTGVGIHTEDGCVDCYIGSGVVMNAELSGYLLNGNFSHGLLSAINCKQYGVDNYGILDPGKVTGTNNRLGNISGLFDASNLLNIINSWSGSPDYRPTLYGNRFYLSGHLSHGNSDILGKITDAFRPKNEIAFPVTIFAFDKISSAYLFVEPNGTVSVSDGANIGKAGGRIYLSNVSWLYA
ncbi:phage head-binding domain-containing protein [Xenorhabdus bovienii]|uniref:phage head-binding domain-containing protein n=1 Tax=Xenorhabdus bovienii TaxID=40576 RepID=UPI0023B32F93|nr:phage head-binding domain-containing protein [Xenorhabdus bovienii]